MDGDQDNQNNQGSPVTGTSNEGQQPPTEVVQTQAVTSTQIQTQPNPSVSEAPTEIPNPKKGSPKVLIIGIFLVLLLLVFGGGYFYLQNQKQNSETQSVTPTGTQETPTPTPDPTADWKTHTTSTYLIKYPKDLLTREDEGSTVTISKWGPTQTEGTELFDGFAVTLQPKEIPNITTEEYAKTQIEEIEKQSVSKVTEGIITITINNYQGVTYTEEGLGTYKQIILGSDDGIMLIQISVLVSDPGNLGFQETVDQILSTFKFISEN